MKYTILKCKYIDQRRIKYAHPVKESDDSEYCTSKCKYELAPEYSIPLIFESPRLKVLDDLSNINEPCIINLGIDKKDKTFINFITQIDKLNINSIHTYSNEWFNREIPLNAVDTLYNSPLNINKNGFILKVKYDPSKEIFNNGIYNSYKENINISDIKKNDKIRIIFLYNGIKIYNVHALPIFEIKQIKHICGKPQSYNISQYIINNENKNLNPTYYPCPDDNDNDSDIEIDLLNEEVVEQNEEVVEQNEEVVEQNEEVIEQNEEVVEQNEEVVKQNEEVVEQNEEVVESNEEVVEQNEDFVESNEEVVEQNKNFVESNEEVVEQVESNEEVVEQNEDFVKSNNFFDEKTTEFNDDITENNNQEIKKNLGDNVNIKGGGFFDN
jgi:hypothetical protein